MALAEIIPLSLRQAVTPDRATVYVVRVASPGDDWLVSNR
jgi:hypothetical protein